MKYTTLRPYQEDGLDQITQSWRAGYRKVLLHMDTGLGKTVIFTTAMKRALENERRSIMVVRGRELVKQASERLFREGVPHGVLMANHPLYRPWEKIQICSIDTIRSRGIYPKADLVVIDEAHTAISDDWLKLCENYKEKFLISVTATPYIKKPLRHLADTVVRPIEFLEAVEQGYIVDARYCVPTMPDLTGIKIQNGDYHKGELEERVNKSTLVGDIVKTWKEKATGLPSIYFAVSVAHSKEIVRQFNEADVRAVHAEAKTSDRERKRMIEGLENGSVEVISNVGIFCIGVDIPCLMVIGMARPTRSYPLFVQQLGRGTRPYKKKNDFLVLDHAGNVIRHGFIAHQPKANLDGRGAVRGLNFKRTKICAACFMAYLTAHCPQCGPQAVSAGSRGADVPKTEEGELIEISGVESYLSILKTQCELRGYKRNWIWYKLRDRYGEKIADEHFPIRGGIRKVSINEL